MPDTPAVLAVYGTLRRGERNAELLAGTRFLGLGRIAGRLHEMPRSAERAYAYPSLVLDGAPGEVVVELYAIPDAATLALADELEAFDPADEAGSEYVRRAVAILGGPVEHAWVYVYNGAIRSMGTVIADGDWVAHRARASEADSVAEQHGR
ncbi:MAG TPA: gamma-glutamylcyclotransferase family protein [Candidatus Deferrimicrobium sp.]|nr:gamma-glutamylcyclotransferase family protein [Candidatus Deferrimicrobium sp.]